MDSLDNTDFKKLARQQTMIQMKMKMKMKMRLLA